VYLRRHGRKDEAAAGARARMAEKRGGGGVNEEMVAIRRKGDPQEEKGQGKSTELHLKPRNIDLPSAGLWFQAYTSSAAMRNS